MKILHSYLILDIPVSVCENEASVVYRIMLSNYGSNRINDELSLLSAQSSVCAAAAANSHAIPIHFVRILITRRHGNFVSEIEQHCKRLEAKSIQLENWTPHHCLIVTSIILFRWWIYRFYGLFWGKFLELFSFVSLF